MSRSDENAERRERLSALVAEHGGKAYFAVPVAGPGVGDWPPDTVVERVDAVWFPSAASGGVIDWSVKAHAEFEDDIGALPATILSLRGYADRPLLGMLLAGRELLSRAYPDHQLLRCLSASANPSWMTPAYLASGIEVIHADPMVVRPTGRPRPGPTHGGSREDALLYRYFRETKGGKGTMFTEVPVADRRLDGLYIHDMEGPDELVSWRKRMGLVDLVRDFDVEIVEVKMSMNTDVIGQAIAGAALLARDRPEHRLITQAVVVAGPQHPPLDWVCHKLGIDVTRFG